MCAILRAGQHPPAFRESVNVGEQNLYAAGKALVGDRDARAHRYTVQMQPRGATIIVGPLHRGGPLEQVPDPVAMAELAVDKQATVLLMPVGARRELMNLPDDVWTKVNIEFYADAADGVFKVLE